MMIEPAVEAKARALMDQSFKVAIRASLTDSTKAPVSQIKRELRVLNAELVRLYARQGNNETRLLRSRMTLENLEGQDDGD